MGQQERAREERKTANKRNVGSKRAGGTGSGEPYVIGSSEWARIMALTAVMAARGGAVRVGFTRDLGALAVGLYDGDDQGTEYVRPSEDRDSALDEIAEAWCGNSFTEYLEWRDAALRMLEPPQQRTTKKSSDGIHSP
jgi:hypothetical protein